MTLVYQGSAKGRYISRSDKVTDLKTLSSEALAKDTVEAESAFQSIIVIGKKLGL